MVWSAARDGGLPVRDGRGDVSVIQSSMPGKQDDASVAKHTVEKQLRRATTTGRNGMRYCENITGECLTGPTLDGSSYLTV